MKFRSDEPWVLVRFVVIGCAVAGIYYGAAWAGTVLGHWSLPVASALAYMLCVPISYILHRVFSFRSQSRVLPESSRFIASSVAGASFAALVPVMLMAAGLSLGAALAANCLITPGLTYLLLSRWVFPERKPA
jgi:putative flippase GtrA